MKYVFAIFVFTYVLPVVAKPVLEEVVVSAQKRSENLQDVPLSVSAIGQDAIEDRQIISFEDLANQIAGFKFGEIVGGGQASIRGVGFSLVSGTGEGSVAIHSDGLFLSRPGATTMLQQDVAGVEVLRGPQGTLYGRNATAGVLNFVSPPPPEEFSFGVSALHGSIGREKYAGHVGGSLLDGKLGVRLSAVSDETDDYFKNIEVDGLDHGARDQIGGRFSLDILPFDWLLFELRSFHAEEEFHGPYIAAYEPDDDSVLAPPGTYADDPYENRLNDQGQSAKELTGGSLKTVIDLNEHLSIISITGYADYRFRIASQDGDGTSVNTFTNFRRENTQTFTQEVMLSSDTDTLDWLVGVYYMSEDTFANLLAYADATSLVAATLDSALGGFISDFGVNVADMEQVTINNLSDELIESQALFSDFTYQFHAQWRVFAGVRYLQEDKEHVFTNYTEVESGAGPTQRVFSCENEMLSIDAEEVKGRIGVQWDINDAMMIYSQFSNGYKSGGFAKGACTDTFEPEELDAFEIGVKSEFFEGRMRANAAIFRYDYNNLQVEEVRLPVVSVNNAQAEVDGAEFELTAIPFEGLEISLNSTYLDARYTEFRNIDNAAGPEEQEEQDLAGNQLNRSPHWSGTLAVQYEHVFSEWGRVLLRGEAVYNSEYTLREFETWRDIQGEHMIYNAYGTLFSADERWSLNVFVKNVSNEVVKSGVLGVSGYMVATWNLPKTSGVELKFRL